MGMKSFVVNAARTVEQRGLDSLPVKVGDKALFTDVITGGTWSPGIVVGVLQDTRECLVWLEHLGRTIKVPCDGMRALMDMQAKWGTKP